MPWEQPGASASPNATVTSNALWLKAREDQADQTVWAKEMLAEKCGSVFESLWDAVNASSNKLETLGNFGAGEIVLADWAAPQLLPHEVEIRDSRGPGQTIG